MTTPSAGSSRSTFSNRGTGPPVTSAIPCAKALGLESEPHRLSPSLTWAEGSSPIRARPRHPLTEPGASYRLISP
jgi:hypothetical protein